MNQCPICSRELEFIFSMGSQPLANKYPKSSDDFLDEVLLEMNVYYCDECNYINIPCDVDRSLFFEEYYYLSSVNKELVIHFNEMAKDIKLRNPQLVLDVGSNDGILLKPLNALNIKCVGLDPSENVSAIANASGLQTVVGFFDDESAEIIKQNHGCPDIICASSVFTHLQDPKGFFVVADSLLADGGEVIIEVEYLRNIVESLGFERFYFDRPHYYSIKSLSRIAEETGFRIVDIKYINAHGGSIRASFGRADRAPISMDIKREISSEAEVLNRRLIEENFDSFKSECTLLKEQLESFGRLGLHSAAYGCPARFSTITNFADIGPELLPYVVDDSPLKSGRFSPGKHVPIVAFNFSENIDNYVVFAYEYIYSIKDKVNSGKIAFFKPIPFQPI
jgi:methylation protein EvaC